MIDDGLRGVAFHEAGHAAAALALGLNVARVEIFHEDYSGGADVAGADRLPLVDHITICLAGINANDMFKTPSHDQAGFRDEVSVSNLIEDFSEAESDALGEEGHQRACHLLKAHPGSVEDIAARLIAEGKIDLAGYVLKR